MKRIIIALFLIMTMISASAISYADEVTGNGNTDSTSKVSSDTIKDDPVFGEIKDKYEDLKALRVEQSGIMEDIKAMNEANKALEAQLRDGYKRDKDSRVREQFAAQTEALKALIEERKDLIEEAQALKSERTVKPVKEPRTKSGDDADATEIADADVPLGATPSPEYSALKQDIDALTAEIKEKAEALKSAKADASAGKEATSPLGQQMKAAHEEIKALRIEIETARVEINLIQAEKGQEWILFREAMTAEDLVSASAHMSRIIELKQQIIDQLENVLSIKTDINDILKELVADMPDSDDGEEPVSPEPEFTEDALEAPEL